MGVYSEKARARVNMNYYQEVTIINYPELSLYFIWSKLYTQLHLALVEQAKATYGERATQSDIGVSFPEYACFEKNGETIAILGSKLRVFAKTKAELEQLNLNKWCERLLDYVHIKSISEVGEKSAEYVVVKKFRQEKNLDSKTRNFAQKHNKTFEEVKASRIAHIAKKYSISEEEAQQRYENPVLEKRPYIQMKSLETGNPFSLEIEQLSVNVAQAGTFNTYGLSVKTTVPHWK